MAGADLDAIFRALAAQIRTNIDEDTNVYPFPVLAPQMPSISVYPADVNHFGTFGPDGQGDLNLRLKVEVDGDYESMGIRLARYLSVGTGHNSSVFDALHSDRELGGVVADCVALTAEWADHDSEPGVAWIPVQIMYVKQNAEVG